MTAQTEQLLGGQDRRALSSTLVGGIALGAVGMMMLSGLVDRTGAVVEAMAPASPAATQFSAHAVGTVAQGTVLTSRPGGGDALGDLTAGTAVRVGGLVRVPAGLGTSDELWVSFADTSGPRYGFVAADSVVLSAGDVPVLQLDGVRASALLSPDAATSQGVADVGGATFGGQSPSSVSSTSQDVRLSTGAVDIAWLPPSVVRWRDDFIAAGTKHDVDPELLAILALVESGGNPRAVSSAGATGLMQIMPGTASGIAQQMGVAGHSRERLLDPAYNIDFGAYYIAQQLKSFGKTGDTDWQQSVELAASAYNGGPGSVMRLQSGGALPRETQSYRRWVGGMWHERHDATSPTLDAWLAAGGRALVARADQG